MTPSGRRRNRIADAVRKKQPTKALTREVRNLQNARDIVEASCRKMSTHCLAGDLDEVEQLDALTAHERLLLDVIRIIAYRAETRMMLPVMQAQGHKPYPRKLLQPLLTPTPTSCPTPPMASSGSAFSVSQTTPTTARSMRC